MVLSLRFARLVEYRAVFFARLLGNLVISGASAVFLWGSVLASRGGEPLQGYDSTLFIQYFLLVPAISYMTMGTEWGSQIISDDIYNGSLSRYLLQPVSLVAYKFAERMALFAFATLQFGMLYLAARLVAPVPGGGPLEWAAFMLFAFAGAALGFFYFMAIETAAFWVEQTWALSTMGRMFLVFLGGTLLPLEFFSAPVREVLERLPFKYFAHFPLMILWGKVGAAEIARSALYLAGWIGVFAATARVLIERGRYIYTGVGQ